MGAGQLVDVKVEPKVFPSSHRRLPKLQSIVLCSRLSRMYLSESLIFLCLFPFPPAFPPTFSPFRFCLAGRTVCVSVCTMYIQCNSIEDENFQFWSLLVLRCVGFFLLSLCARSALSTLVAVAVSSRLAQLFTLLLCALLLLCAAAFFLPSKNRNSTVRFSRYPPAVAALRCAISTL